MTACSYVLRPLLLAGLLACFSAPSSAQAPTSTALLVTLAASTGGSNSSFAEFSIVVSGNTTADEISAGGTVIVYDKGEEIGTSKLSPVNGSSLPGASAGFLIATLTSGYHNLTASYVGNKNAAASTSLPIIVTAGQAVPVKHDIGVPDPFQQGGRPESSLGVSVRPPTTLAAGQSGAQQYANIAEDPSFQKGTASWILQGNAMVSASSSSGSSGNAPVRLGQGSYIWQALWNQITPLTAYAIEVQSTIDGGSGLAGATFYTGAGRKLSAQGIRLASSGDGTQGGTLVAPPGSYFVALWVGNWQDGGTLQVSNLQFGPLTSGQLPLDCSVQWRKLPQGGVGINTNYLMDISPEWRTSGGPTYVESLKAMGIASLRYPGGEEANTYEWAPPPYTAQTKPQPVLTTGSGFPGGDWLFYNRFLGSFQGSVMDFDQLMDICIALNITNPYLVLNHDSVNVGGPDASSNWGYGQLKQAAVAWAEYIVQRNYSARHFEFSNESWKTNQAAQYAWALLDWVPAIKAAYPGALIGANGPAGRLEIGNKDQGVPWWPQVLGASSSVVDFVATHPYPVYGWDYLDYVAGRAPNLQQGVIEADIAINTFAAPEDRERIRIAVTETGVIDWRDKWQNERADLGHALVALDVMANILSHPKVDVAHFWTTRWRFGGFAPSNNPGSAADALEDDNSLTAIGKALVFVGKYFRSGTLMFVGSSQSVRTWAVKQQGTSWALLLINKALNATQQDVSLSSCMGIDIISTIWMLNGTGYTDPSPVIVQLPNTTAVLAKGVLSIALPPVSITAVEF